MYCENCGVFLPESVRFCTNCGVKIAPAPEMNINPAPENPNAAEVKQPEPKQPEQAVTGVKAGYSERISDPAFARYLKNTSRWSSLFSLILAVASVAGFYIYGETSPEMDNPEALYIGLGIGGMFLLIALYSIIARKRSKTWDGVVVEKTVKKKNRRQSTGSGDNDYYIKHYTEYTVIVRENHSGKTHNLTAEDDTTVFDYYKVGDLVRHHAGLNSYEKYDKSQDSIIFCNACATLCQITDDVCWRCNCPLLK